MSSFDEVLKAVFPFLDGTDLVSCMAVCKQWREIAKDDYFWKCLCARRWPSICKRPNSFRVTYYKLYQTFHKRQQRQALLPPRLCFEDLEFFIDMWTEDKLIFSEVVPGPILEAGIKNLPPGVSEGTRLHLDCPQYKMTLPVEPRFTVALSQNLTVSVLTRRKDSDRVACIINNSVFGYTDRTSNRDQNEGLIDVFGIEVDFGNAANSKEEVLWLLDMLDWK